MVAHAVDAPHQHLERDIGNGLAQRIQALPGGFVQEAVAGIKGGAAPYFQREGILQNVRCGFGNGGEIPGAHPGGQQRLVGIPEGGIGDKQFLLVLDPTGQGLGTALLEQGPEVRVR